MDVKKTLDARGLLCPMPVIKTKKAIMEIEVGDILEMLATDKGSIPDMEAWARQTGHELIQSEDRGETFRFLIRRTH